MNEFAAPRSLPPELEASLDGVRVKPIAEYLARRLRIDQGEHCSLMFDFTKGALRETSFNRRAVRNEELEAIAPARP